MRTTDLYRELKNRDLEDVELIMSPALKRLTFRFYDNTVLKITYYVNNRKVTAAMIATTVAANQDKAVMLLNNELWVPESATVHLD